MWCRLTTNGARRFSNVSQYIIYFTDGSIFISVYEYIKKRVKICQSPNFFHIHKNVFPNNKKKFLPIFRIQNFYFIFGTKCICEFGIYIGWKKKVKRNKKKRNVTQYYVQPNTCEWILLKLKNLKTYSLDGWMVGWFHMLYNTRRDVNIFHSLFASFIHVTENGRLSVYFYCNF